MNMSWATRVRRDDLVTFHVDGTHGSAVAGLSSCRAQSRVSTPRPIWNPDEKQTINFMDQWQEIPDSQTYDNGFKIQWNTSSATSSKTSPTSGPCPKAPKACNWSKPHSRAGKSAAGWTFLRYRFNSFLRPWYMGCRHI